MTSLSRIFKKKKPKKTNDTTVSFFLFYLFIMTEDLLNILKIVFFLCGYHIIVNLELEPIRLKKKIK